jgi:hypothetical protein
MLNDCRDYKQRILNDCRDYKQRILNDCSDYKQRMLNDCRDYKQRILNDCKDYNKAVGVKPQNTYKIITGAYLTCTMAICLPVQLQN